MSNTLPTELDKNCTPIFHTSPRTLLELASLRIALQMWLEKFNRIVYPPKEQILCISFNESKFEPETESLTEFPIAIRNTVKSWFPIIAEELQIVLDFITKTLYQLNYDDIYSCLGLVVFGGNGTAHFKSTIENFCKEDSLNNLKKFEMACVCCMEEKIDTIWPLVCDTLRIEDMRFNKNYLMYYWVCRKRGELGRIPSHRFGSIEHLMIDKCSWHLNWLAIEYFLTLLDRDDRFNQIDRLLDRDFGRTLTRYLLPFLETSVQHRVVDRRPLDILLAFTDYYQMFDYAIQTWLHIRNFITDEQFYGSVIRVFIRYRNHQYNTYGGRESEIYHYVFYESLLAEIWFHSPRHLKKFILDFHFLDICLEMTKYTDGILKNLSRDISFLFSILSDADIDLRKKFWDENWSEWIIGVSSSHLNRLMTLCLVNTEAIDDLKKHLKESHLFAEYCNTLFIQRYLNELNDFLSWVCGDVGEKLNIKLKLLTAAEPWKEYICEPYDVKQIKTYYDFIDAMFSNETLANDFKNQFIMTEDNLNILYKKLDQKKFSDIKIIVEEFISSELRGEIKEVLLNRFRELITKGELHKFHESDFENFLMWCAEEDKQRVRNFVKFLSIEGIFEAALLNCMMYKPYTRYGFFWLWRKCMFVDLNKFLSWYFESASLSRTFKRERIQIYEGMLEAEIESIFAGNKDSIVAEMKKELLLCDVEGDDGN